jgi:hypothetical protein
MHLLTIEQKDLLVGQSFAPASILNPVQDANGDWFISPQEVDQCINTQFLWIKDLTTKEYIPPIHNEDFDI